MQRVASLPATLILVAALTVVACDHYTDLGSQGFSTDPAIEFPEVSCSCECVGGGTPTACVVPVEADGESYRMTTITLEQPAQEALANLIDEAWAEDIDNDLLNYFLTVTALDTDAGTISLLLEDYEYADGAYTLRAEGATIEATLDGCSFASTEEISFGFTHAVLPEPLPVTHMTVSGTVSSDGTAIDNGILSGVLVRDDITGILVLGMPFDALLESFGAMADVDLDDDGTMDAWLFELAFDGTATPLTGAE